MARAQVQLGEAITVVILLIFLIIIGLGFYAYVRQQSLDREFRDAKTLDLIELSVRASNLPQLACTIKGERQGACYDAAKVEALASRLRTAAQDDPAVAHYYASLFGRSTIELVTLYPEPAPEAATLVLYDGAPPDPAGHVRDVRRTPLLLQDPRTHTAALGVLRVTRYS